jgi:diguanylate cyclase (GGDEF)-like protein
MDRPEPAEGQRVSTSTPALRDGARPFINFDELRRSLIAGYAVTALTAVVAVLTIPSDHGNVGLLAVAACELVLVAILAAGRGLPVWAIKVIAFPVAVVVIGAVVAVAKPIGPAPLYYIWPALTCGRFGTRRDARLTLAWFCLTFAGALALAHEVQVPAVMYLSVVSIVGLVLALQQRDTRELERAATTDGLTRLLNRRAFNHAFAREVQRARTAGLPLSLVVFDLDHFKQLNDGFGHAAGDAALKAFSAILREHTAPGDLVARMGGEEFAAVLFDTDLDGAQSSVDAIARGLREWAQGAERTLTTSAGIAQLGPDADSPDELLQAADRALYAAKDAGRNRVVRVGERAARELPRAA